MHLLASSFSHSLPVNKSHLFLSLCNPWERRRDGEGHKDAMPQCHGKHTGSPLPLVALWGSLWRKKQRLETIKKQRKTKGTKPAKEHCVTGLDNKALFFLSSESSSHFSLRETLDDLSWETNKIKRWIWPSELREWQFGVLEKDGWDNLSHHSWELFDAMPELLKRNRGILEGWKTHTYVCAIRKKYIK